MARALRLLLFEGPGEVGLMRGVLIGRQWCLLINLSEDEALEGWPALKDIWHKKQIDTITLTSGDNDSSDLEATTGDVTLSGKDWVAKVIQDELRPSVRSLIVETAQLVVGIGVGASGEEPPAGRQRALIINAGWTHIFSFPDREEVRSAMRDALRSAPARVHFISDLAWDVSLFRAVARESGREADATSVPVGGSTARKVWQARQVLSDVGPRDTVLIGMVPGRDDRGRFQHLRSDFAERTPLVRAFPAVPLSTGPGISRDEALEAVGLWLPTNVLVAEGPISEQVLLARHLEENARAPVIVGIRGGEYRLPDFELIRTTEAGQRPSAATRLSGVASRAGLVVVAFGLDEDGVILSGAGLAESVDAILPKIRISRKGKTAERVVREVEMAFSSRGLPVPAVRFQG